MWYDNFPSGDRKPPVLVLLYDGVKGSCTEFLLSPLDSFDCCSGVLTNVADTRFRFGGEGVAGGFKIGLSNWTCE